MFGSCHFEQEEFWMAYLSLKKEQGKKKSVAASQQIK